MRRVGWIMVVVMAVGCRRPPAPTETDGGEQPSPVEPTPSPEPEPEPPPTCDGQPCEPPRECISYFGIAGPSGPMFHACEIRCEPEIDNGGCPQGMRCATIADGPGNVCQPE